MNVGGPACFGVLILDTGDAQAMEQTQVSVLSQTTKPRWCRPVALSSGAEPGSGSGGGPGFDVALRGANHVSPSLFVVVLHAGERLDPEALASVCEVVNADRTIDIVYSDHRELEPDSVVLKSAWSPELLRSSNYLGPLCAIRTSIVSTERATSRHDLILAASEHAEVISHVPRVLATATAGSEEEADGPAVQRQLDRLRIPACVRRVDDGVLALEPALVDAPLASIIILSGGTERELQGNMVLLVRQAIESILRQTDYPRFEIVVVLDRHSDAGLAPSLVALDPKRVRIVQDQQPFNFAAANNLGARHANGEILVFVNDDTEVVTPTWLQRLVMYLAMPDVGVVGARLHFGDGRIQHAGVVARDGWVEHRYAGYHPDAPSYQRWLDRTSDVSAVTGACLAMGQETFHAVGQFPVEFPLNFNDIDLCLRVRETGYRVVIDQYCLLLHHETSSRKAGIDPAEQQLFDERWGHRTQHDPFHHSGFTQVRMEQILPPEPLRQLRVDLAELAALRTGLSGDNDPAARGAPAAMEPRRAPNNSMGYIAARAVSS